MGAMLLSTTLSLVSINSLANLDSKPAVQSASKTKTQQNLPSQKQIHSALMKAQDAAMTEYFNFLLNRSKQDKQSDQFLSSTFPDFNDSPRFKEILKQFAGKRTPVITSISNGIQIEEAGQITKIQLAKSLGAVLIDGQITQAEIAKKDTAQLSPSSLPRLFLNSMIFFNPAQAAGPQSILSLLKHGWKHPWQTLIQGSLPFSKEAKLSQQLGSNAAVAASGAGLGAVAGCGVGLTTDRPHENCEAYAINAASVAGLASAGFYTGSLGIKTAENLSAITKLIVAAGFTTLAAKGVVAPLAYRDGVKLICVSKEDFHLVDIERGFENGLLWSVKGNTLLLPDNQSSGLTGAELIQQLRKNPSNKNFTDEQLGQYAYGMSLEINGLSEECKKHGKGYTKAFRSSASEDTLKKNPEKTPGQN